MSTKWNKQSLSAALPIHINFDCNANEIAIDSRHISTKAIFLALTTGKTDGHLHIKKALENGADCAIAQYLPENCTSNDKIIIVPDTLEALTQLGAYQRKLASHLKAIAVTGSVGKTTVKEIIASVLQNFGKTTFSRASYNNHIGVPFTLEKLDHNTRYGVFEIGMNHFGEIEPLSRMAQPDIAIITTIAPSHIGQLGSMEGIADEKSEIFSGLSSRGVALIHGDHPLAERMQSNAKKYDVAEVFKVGKADGMDARLITYQTSDKGCMVTAQILGKIITYPLQFVGEHYAFNSLYVLLCTEILGLDLQTAAHHLSAAVPVIGRGQMFTLNLANSLPIFVFDDAYNANPTSMKAGLKAFCELKTNGKRIAIIGQMGELGDFSDAYHQEIGEFTNTLPVDLVHVVGEAAKPLYNALHDSKKGMWTKTVDSLKPDFISNLRGHESLFLKGSNSQRLYELVSLMQNSLKKVF